jgi:branched-chain amino acid transport system ATP-binding protein
MSLLNVEGLSKRFGGLKAVDGVDLRIERGEIVGLIGPNGAGKTTFVELLTGGIPSTSGRIEFDGRDITKMSNHERCRLGIARTFQVPRPFGGSSVLENVMIGSLFGRATRKLTAHQARRKAESTLQSVGLWEAREALTSSLTTAGLKRLELARCLATDAELIFLDEPLGGLNPTEVNDSLALIRSVRDAGTTILFIEHIIPAVLALCERVVVLANGRKLAEGTGIEVTANPLVRDAYLGNVSGAADRYARKRSGLASAVSEGVAS